MRVARYYAPGDVRIEDADEPQAGPDELKLRVRACSVCGTDVKIRANGHRDLVPPRVLGHEIAGDIVHSANGWQAGDRVQITPALPCGQCADCRRGRPTVCAHRRGIGYQFDGGFAEYMIVPAAALAVGGVHGIPDRVDHVAASVAEPLACVLNAQEIAGVGTDDTVAVLGPGPTGCLHVRLAYARGARRVFLVGQRPNRLDRAAALVTPDAAIAASQDDPVAAVLGLTGGRGADVVIVAAGSPQAQQDALRMAARHGRISFFAGLPGDAPVPLDVNLIHYRELTVLGGNGASPDHNRRALDLIGSGGVTVSDLVTHRMSLTDLHTAIDLTESGDAIKVTIVS